MVPELSNIMLKYVGQGCQKFLKYWCLKLLYNLNVGHLLSLINVVIFFYANIMNIRTDLINFIQTISIIDTITSKIQVQKCKQYKYFKDI